MSSETNATLKTGRLWEWVPLRLITLALLLLAATILSTIVTRLVVPPAPSPGHAWILAKNLLLPILLLWVYGRAVQLLEQREPKEIGLRNGAPLFILGAVLGLSIISVYVLVLSAIGAAALTRGAGMHDAVPALNEFLVPWLTAVGEELLFRLIVFRLVEEALGTGLAVLISALLFGLSHATNPGASPAGVFFLAGGMGTLLAFAYAATRSVWFPIGLHFGWNFAEGCLYGLPNSGQADPLQILHTATTGSAIVTGGAFGPEGSLLLFVLTLVGTVILAALTVRRHQWHSLRFSLRKTSPCA